MRWRNVIYINGIHRAQGDVGQPGGVGGGQVQGKEHTRWRDAFSAI